MFDLNFDTFKIDFIFALNENLRNPNFFLHMLLFAASRLRYPHLSSHVSFVRGSLFKHSTAIFTSLARFNHDL